MTILPDLSDLVVEQVSVTNDVTVTVAVLVGLTLPWSQGPVEGHVNRLKLIKRSMYG